MSFLKDEFLLTGNKYEIPEAVHESPGINLGDHYIRSVLLSTDLSYIQNLHADAVMTVNPFEKSNDLDRVIIDFTRKPVFCDVGGGLLRQDVTIKLSKGAFDVGAAGVLISKPTSPEIIKNLRSHISGKLIYTVMYDTELFAELADAGVDIFNITTGEDTAQTVAKVRNLFPEVPIMANGGPHNSTIRETIEMGADAIVVNPPTATEILRSIFDGYRGSRG